MFSLNVYDCLQHTYTPTQNIPKHLNRSKDNNKRGWKGYTLSNHPCVTPVWYRRGGGPRVVVSTAAFHARVRGSVPGLGGLKETKMFLPHSRVTLSIVGSLRDREIACSATDRQGSNFESCVRRTVSPHSSHHPQEVLLAKFSLYVHKSGLKPDSFHFWYRRNSQNIAHWYYVLTNNKNLIKPISSTHGDMGLGWAS